MIVINAIITQADTAGISAGYFFAYSYVWIDIGNDTNSGSGNIDVAFDDAYKARTLILEDIAATALSQHSVVVAPNDIHLVGFSGF